MLLLKNGTYIDWKTLKFVRADILAEPGTHGGISLADSRDTGAGPSPVKIIDCTGLYITKSFANGHHHAYSALAAGMPAPSKNPSDFQEILKYVWWTLDKALDAEMIRLSALVTAIACARNGVTMVIDHHASPHAVRGSLGIIAKAFEEVGVNHLLCYEISDRDGEEIAQQGLDETDSYLRYRAGLVGLHASFTVSDKTVKKAVDLAVKHRSGIHIHIAEDRSDQEHCMQVFHKRVVERMNDAGILQFPKTILAHCLHLDDHERGLVAGSSAWVVQNAASNQNNCVGTFSSRGLGDHIMLGTDGMHSDMLRSAREAFYAGKVPAGAGNQKENITPPEACDRFRNIHHYTETNGFGGDGANNLVVLDYDPPTPFHAENFSGHFIYGIHSGQVRHVISNGEPIVENGNVLKVNEKDILAEARVQADRLWSRMRRPS